MAKLAWKREEACLGVAHGFGFAFGDESEDVWLGVAFELALGDVPCDSCHWIEDVQRSCRSSSQQRVKAE